MMSVPPVNQPMGTPFSLKQVEGTLTLPTLPDEVELPVVATLVPVEEARLLWTALAAPCPTAEAAAEGVFFDELCG